jgi:hypothetical protein
MESEKSNDTDLETKEQQKLYSLKRSYLKCKRKLDVDNMTYDEIMNFPVRKNHPKYDTEEERKEAKRKINHCITGIIMRHREANNTIMTTTMPI